jgi:hypothetical protein
VLPDRFRLAVNVALYASGKIDLRNRLSTPYVPEPARAAERSVAVARLKYPGNWNPEPYAWTRFARLLQEQTGSGIAMQEVALKDLKPDAAPLAHLTGTAAYQFTADQIAAVKAYVNGGGVLLVDCCGGGNAFSVSVRSDLIAKAFVGDPQPLPPDDPLLAGLSAGKANDSPLRLRPYAVDRLGRAAPPILRLKSGRGYVLFSALDLTSGLLGTHTWGILGYQPDSAQRFLRNLVESVAERSR